MEELTLTVEQGLLFLAVLTPLTIYLWTHLGAYQLDIEPKIKSEGKEYRQAPKSSLRGLYPACRETI